MAQFTVHRNSSARSVGTVPFVLDVQSDLLEALSTRVVVPLVRAGVAGPPIDRLQPIFRVEGIEVVLSTAELAGVSRAAIGEPVGSLAERRDDIVAALDFLVTGI